jgi:hypothetical protein
MTDFLPDGYTDIPSTRDNYMKLQDGLNRLRVLSSAIVGWEGWKTQADGSKKPIRRRMEQPLSVTEIDDEERVNHFWAFCVWNYQAERVQILEITQKGIQTAIKGLAKDQDWGSPKNYDLVIEKTGKLLETRYQVTPKPSKKLDEGIIATYEAMNINLDALYDGLDPFADNATQIADAAEKAGL